MYRCIELFRILSPGMYEKNERHGREWGTSGSVDQIAWIFVSSAKYKDVQISH